MCVRFWSPCIELVADWEERDRDLACVGRAGHSILFLASIVDVLPEEHVAELIAHELAHVWLIAGGQEDASNKSLHRWDDPVEIAADEVMDYWGFEPDSIDDWLMRNRETVEPMHRRDWLVTAGH